MSDLIDVSDIVDDPEFDECFIVKRSSGYFALGGFKETSEELEFSGAIQPIEPKDIDKSMHGDRITGAIAIWCDQPLYVTRTTQNEKGLSDIVIWEGAEYRIRSVKPWGKNGYWKAEAVRMAGK